MSTQQRRSTLSSSHSAPLLFLLCGAPACPATPAAHIRDAGLVLFSAACQPYWGAHPKEGHEEQYSKI